MIWYTVSLFEYYICRQQYTQGEQFTHNGLYAFTQLAPTQMLLPHKELFQILACIASCSTC